jgi:hypothetical protein
MGQTARIPAKPAPIATHGDAALVRDIGLGGATHHRKCHRVGHIPEVRDDGRRAELGVCASHPVGFAEYFGYFVPSLSRDHVLLSVPAAHLTHTAAGVLVALGLPMFWYFKRGRGAVGPHLSAASEWPD